LATLIELLSREPADALWTALAAAALLLLTLITMRVLRAAAVRKVSHRTILGLVIRRTEAPVQAVVSLAVMHMVCQAAPQRLWLIGSLRHVTLVLLIGAITWLLLRVVRVTRESVAELNPVDTADNLLARSRITQVRVLTRTLNVVILCVGLALALMTFPSVRQIGASLLASAGIAGLAVGLAARPVIGNLLAGLQIALSQPIRIDDVLVIEGEWGRVEEITGTYVVVAIWDQRRLVVPLQYFIEKPFQNWTRQTSELLGSVMLWVDYRMPVEPVRAELKRLCSADPDWDGRVANVQVTETSATAMQLRILVSSADSGRNWDLRCRVREGLIGFIAREHPACLPQLRAELVGAHAATAPPPP